MLEPTSSFGRNDLRTLNEPISTLPIPIYLPRTKVRQKSQKWLQRGNLNPANTLNRYRSGLWVFPLGYYPRLNPASAGLLIYARASAHLHAFQLDSLVLIDTSLNVNTLHQKKTRAVLGPKTTPGTGVELDPVRAKFSNFPTPEEET